MKRRSLGRARGFGAPLWQMEPSGEVVLEICRRALRSVSPTRDDLAAKQARYRRAAMISSRMLAEAHIFVEGAGQ